MNKKCIVALLLALIVCLGLCGCGKTCAYGGCEEKTYEGSIHCEEHACKASDECENEVVGDHVYCTDHRCAVEDCDNIKAKGEKNCKKHLVCATDGCSNKSFDGSFRCADHKCTVEDCPGDPTYRDGAPGAYCEDHDCDYDDGYTCLSVATRGSENYSYCSAHVCKNSECDNEGKAKYGGYCWICVDDEEEEDGDKCNICGGSYTCADCGAEGLYCYNSSFGTGQDHYCSTHWADIAEYMYYDEDDDIYRSYYD